MDKKFKTIIIVVVAVIGITTISAVAFMFLTLQNKLKDVQTQTQTQSQTKGEGKEYDPETLELMMLTDPITSNIATDESGMPHVVKVAIGFRIDTTAKDYKTVSDTLKNKQILIRDEVFRILRGQTYEMMTRAGENSAQDKLSEEILTKVNELLGTTSIKEVRFGEFFVQ